MKSMRKILFLICLFSLSFYSCAIRNSLAPKRGELDAERTFTAQRIKSGKSAGYFDIPTRLVKTTDRLAIYLQTTYREGISSYGLNKMAQEFDYYYDDMTNIYGGHSDIDGNGKIIIVLMDINVNKDTGNVTLAYFNPNDMYSGNRGEVLYMDLSNANKNIDKSIGTLIHEFQHLINYSHYLSGNRGTMESWLNEALSESTSILFNKTTASNRIVEFNQISYYCFYTWNLPSGYGFVNYPSASVFMNWLYIKSGNCSDIFKKIAESTDPADWNKVLAAAKGCSIDGSDSWENLLLTWMSDVVSNNVKIDNTNAVVKTISGDTNLYPGAIVAYNNNNCNVNGNGNIVTRQIGGSSKTNIVLNKDTSLNSNSYIPVRLKNSFSSGNSLARQRIIENKEETRYINILLDENGNIL